jgi:geranylgeranyl diphosphate synthase type I
LGEAFQLRDDLLGLFGDPARTGKANLDDLRTQRPTALLAEAWRAADAEDRARLRALLGRRSLDADGLAAVRDVMKRLEAPDRIERMIDARVETATRSLDEMDIPEHAARALTALARSAAVRAH